MKKCKTCSKEFQPFNSLDQFCSFDCQKSAPKKLKKKKTNRQYLVKKLDILCSEIIRQKETKCVICGSTNKLTAGHIFSRKSYITRWDFDNIHTQCWPCNFLHTKDQWPYFNWVIQTYGLKYLEDLRIKSKTIKKFTNNDLEDLYSNIKLTYLQYTKNML